MVKQSLYRPGQAEGSRGLRFQSQDNQYMKAVRFSPTHCPPLHPKKYARYSSLLAMSTSELQEYVNEQYNQELNLQPSRL